MLIDGGDGFHDEVKSCLLVDKHCLLVFEFGSEGGKLTKSEFDCYFGGILGCFNCCDLLCELRKKFSILEERSWVRSDKAIVGLMVVGWVVWEVSEQKAVAVELVVGGVEKAEMRLVSLQSKSTLRERIALVTSMAMCWGRTEWLMWIGGLVEKVTMAGFGVGSECCEECVQEVINGIFCFFQKFLFTRHVMRPELYCITSWKILTLSKAGWVDSIPRRSCWMSCLMWPLLSTRVASVGQSHQFYIIDTP